jgi:putative hydrolase of the HAD superfamily
VFSNTNASHKETWTHLYPEVVHAFDSIFASHELGLRKPEPQAFARIAALIGTRPADILFFDDLPENVEAAKDCGFQAVLARSPSDVRDALERAGLLTQHAPRDA